MLVDEIVDGMCFNLFVMSSFTLKVIDAAFLLTIISIEDPLLPIVLFSMSLIRTTDFTRSSLIAPYLRSYFPLYKIKTSSQAHLLLQRRRASAAGNPHRLAIYKAFDKLTRTT